VIRPPRPLDLNRACPLVLLEAPLLTDAWLRFADKNHIVLAPVDAPSNEAISPLLSEATRRFPIDAQRLFFVGKDLGSFLVAFHDQVAAATPKTDPEAAWAELKTSHVNGVQQSALVVVVTGLRNTRGIIAAQLFPTEESFKKRQTTLSIVAPITEKKEATLTFEKLERGTYALMLLHDENKNGKMDTGPFGIPKEGFAISRDPKVRFGPPRWKDGCFLLTNASAMRELVVKAQYL
jgi:uncharacterized protein (DUF2141 family)